MVNRVKEILEAHGADPAHWPPLEAGEVARALASDPALQASLEEARALDEALEPLASVDVPTDLKANLMSDAAAALGGDQLLSGVVREPVASGLMNGLRSALGEFFGLVRSPALAGAFASLLVVGVWMGANLNAAAPLTEEDLIAAYGQDLGFWEDEEIELGGGDMEGGLL